MNTKIEPSKYPKLTLTRIISGGQTGADRGGLLAATSLRQTLGLDISPGGVAPRGYRTELNPGGFNVNTTKDITHLTGPALTAYGEALVLHSLGLTEHKSHEYPPRTLENIIKSDATLLIGRPTSRGSKLTALLCERYDRPLMHIPFPYTQSLLNGPPHISREALYDGHMDELAAWLLALDVITLNVAGNRESKNPGICTFTKQIIFDAISLIASAPTLEGHDDGVHRCCGHGPYND